MTTPSNPDRVDLERLRRVVAPHPVDPGELGEYAWVLRREGDQVAAARLPEIARHLNGGCEQCGVDLEDLFAFLDEEATDERAMRGVSPNMEHRVLRVPGLFWKRGAPQRPRIERGPRATPVWAAAIAAMLVALPLGLAYFSESLPGGLRGIQPEVVPTSVVRNLNQTPGSIPPTSSTPSSTPSGDRVMVSGRDGASIPVRISASRSARIAESIGSGTIVTVLDTTVLGGTTWKLVQTNSGAQGYLEIDPQLIDVIEVPDGIR
jgi:hypothetical protein